MVRFNLICGFQTSDCSAMHPVYCSYVPRTGSCVAKTYADGSAVAYAYTPDNLPLRTTYASGRWKEYAYDAHALSDGGLVAGK